MTSTHSEVIQEPIMSPLRKKKTLSIQKILRDLGVRARNQIKDQILEIKFARLINKIFKMLLAI